MHEQTAVEPGVGVAPSRLRKPLECVRLAVAYSPLVQASGPSLKRQA